MEYRRAVTPPEDMPRKHLTVGRAANSLASGGAQRASSRATWRRTRWSSGRRSLPEKRPKQKAALVVYCLSSTQNNQTSATMRLSLFKPLFNVNNAVFEGVEVKQSPDGVVRKLFKNPCSQAELNKIVPFGFSLQRQKNGVFFCH